MDPITQQVVLATAGAAAGDATYVDDVFSTTVYTGNSSGTGSGDEQVITTGIDNTEKSLIWFKNRSSSSSHALFDTERTSPDYRWLRTDSSGVELQSAAVLKDRTTTGFTVVNATSGSGVATTNPSNSEKMVAWNFRAMPGFFDIVTYSGTGSAHSISHSLGSVPGMIFYKAIDDSREWMVYHRSLGASQGLILNDTYAAFSSSDFGSGPTSTHFSVGNTAVNNTSGKNYIAYLFAHDDQSFGTNSDEAIVHCGSFTGSASELSVDIGFEPQWILFKNSDAATRDWMIFDSMRDQALRPNLASDNSSNITSNVRFEPRGFRLLAQNDHNISGDTTVFMAIRRPHKPPTAGTDVLDIVTRTSVSPNLFSIALLYADIAWNKITSATGSWMVSSRLTGREWMRFNETVAETEASAGFIEWDYNYKVNPYLWQSGASEVNYVLKRAPGFMDVVTYEGNGTAGRTVNHNLEAVPELMIVKARDRDESWPVYSSATGATKGLFLNTNGDTDTGSVYWNDTAPTAQQFSLGTLNAVNRNTTKYIAYLFATLPGISKVGSYSGSTGSNIDVDCGFSAGARFILIKRTDSTGDWYVWDSTRGIVSGNDPYVLLNTTGAQVTNTDYIDPLNAGFTVTSSAPAALNTSGGSYIYLSVA